MKTFSLLLEGPTWVIYRVQSWEYIGPIKALCGYAGGIEEDYVTAPVDMSSASLSVSVSLFGCLFSKQAG